MDNVLAIIRSDHSLYSQALFKIFNKTFDVKTTFENVNMYDVIIFVSETYDKNSFELIQKSLSNYTGRIYGMFVTLDYNNQNMFDHIFVFDTTIEYNDPNITSLPNIMLVLNYPKLLTYSNILRVGYFDTQPKLNDYKCQYYKLDQTHINFMTTNIDICICNEYYSNIYCQITNTKYTSELFLIKTILSSVAISRTIPDFSMIVKIISKKMRQIPSTFDILSLEETLNKCKLHIKTINMDSKNTISTIYLNYIISGKITEPTINLSNLTLYNTIKALWIEKSSEVLWYYPNIANFKRKILIELDQTSPNEYTNFHRSGWAYSISGLMNLNASALRRNVDDKIYIDTYVDRTFHWGSEILKIENTIPYKKPWVGFIHHTFETDHSEYNSTALMENILFKESLKTCKGLIVLSNDLAEQIRNVISNIRIYVLDHPTEFVSNMFTMAKFLQNKNKKVVQIGAWLRNPYAIYELNTNMTKIALKGHQMDLYFPPPDYLTRLKNALILNNDTNTPSICRPCISRPEHSYNKFCLGALDMLDRQKSSVEIIEKLDNENYDQLLSENIVFLNLSSCSASNTVIECIVRNTILLVNRLPALEEILGKYYPGFYNDFVHASNICGDITQLINIHTYLTKLDKSKFMLETFVNRFQDIIMNLDNPDYQQQQRLLFNPYAISQPKYICYIKNFI